MPYEWVGSAGVADDGTLDSTHNVAIAEISDPGVTFIRAIITLDLLHKFGPEDLSIPRVWAPVVVGVDWRGRSGVTSPRALFDAAGDWSLWRGVNWSQETVVRTSDEVEYVYRHSQQLDFIDVNGERRLAPYADPLAVLWLSVGYGVAGVLPDPVSIREFTMAWTARILLLVP